MGGGITLNKMFMTFSFYFVLLMNVKNNFFAEQKVVIKERKPKNKVDYTKRYVQTFKFSAGK